MIDIENAPENNIVRDFFAKDSFLRRNFINPMKKLLPWLTLFFDVVKGLTLASLGFLCLVVLSPFVVLENIMFMVLGIPCFVATGMSSQILYGISTIMKRPEIVTENNVTIIDAKDCRLFFSVRRDPSLTFSVAGIQGVDLSWNYFGLQESQCLKLMNILENMHHNANLKVLGLRGNHLAGNQRVRGSLGDIFRKISSDIHTLDLRDNFLQKLSLVELNALERSLPSIKYIYLSSDEYNQMSLDQRRALYKMAPNIKNFLVDNHGILTKQISMKIIEDVAVLNYLGGNIPTKIDIESESQTVPIKGLPLDTIRLIASYLYVDSEFKKIDSYLITNAKTESYHPEVAFFIQHCFLSESTKPKPTSFFSNFSNISFSVFKQPRLISTTETKNPLNEALIEEHKIEPGSPWVEEEPKIEPHSPYAMV